MGPKEGALSERPTTVRTFIGVVTWRPCSFTTVVAMVSSNLRAVRSLSTSRQDVDDQIEEQSRPSPIMEQNENKKAQIERLGRERPAKFKSLWSEVLFCYSVLASQMMAVSLPLQSSRHRCIISSHLTGIFRLRFQRRPSRPHQRAGHPCSVRRLAR